MYAFSADTYTIRQKETLRGMFRLGPLLKIFRKVGCARHAESEWNTSKKRNKKRIH